MSLRPWTFVALLGFAAACGSDGKEADEPQTAREKMRREAKKDKDAGDGTGKSWGKWRYSGTRAECFFRTGQKCFKTEAAACSTLRCKKPQKCQAEGAAPAQVSCK